MEKHGHLTSGEMDGSLQPCHSLVQAVLASSLSLATPKAAGPALSTFSPPEFNIVVMSYENLRSEFMLPDTR